MDWHTQQAYEMFFKKPLKGNIFKHLLECKWKKQNINVEYKLHPLWGKKGKEKSTEKNWTNT